MLPTPDHLIETFAVLPDWEARYAYLIDLGRDLPPMDPALKVDEVLVPGCTSRVWLVMERQGESCRFHIDSDAAIVKGLCAILLVMVQDRPVTAIRALDLAGIFETLHLEGHLSPNRRNGFFAMVDRIKKITA